MSYVDDSLEYRKREPSILDVKSLGTLFTLKHGW